MMGKLIALESTDQQLLDKTAQYLALKLQSEGKVVEVMNFPQAKQSSGHFVESHQKGDYGEVNPYAASMFYILDRYDASPQIRHYLEQGAIVICKSYRGSTLAKLGASISDAPTRKGFYIWADSLESGTFGVPRPDMAIVLSEELPTLYELCELFPKDYIFAVDPTKVRNILNKIIPPAPAIMRKTNKHTMSWHAALQMAGRGVLYDFIPEKGYSLLSKKSNAQKIYANGLKELELLAERAVKKLASPNAKDAPAYLQPIGIKGTMSTEPILEKKYKNSILASQLEQSFSATYGQVDTTPTIVAVSPLSELDVLPALLMPKTELSAQQIAATLDKTPIRKKLELFKSYLAGYDNAPMDNPLTGIHATVSLLISYYDLAKLAREQPSIRFSIQKPSPRWGFTIPANYEHAIDEIEDCFASSLKLHSQLEAQGEMMGAQYVVLGGHVTPCVLTLDGAAIRSLAKQKNKWVLAKIITDSLANQFPLITEL